MQKQIHLLKFGSFSVADPSWPYNVHGDSSGPLIRNHDTHEPVVAWYASIVNRRPQLIKPSLIFGEEPNQLSDREVVSRAPSQSSRPHGGPESRRRKRL